MNLPNQLTLARIVMVPVFVGLMSFNNAFMYSLAYVTFTIASITDYYDGKIARERGIITNFGKLFDPVADKVLMASAFVMMMEVPDLNVPGWTVIVILTREFLVTGIRALAASEGIVIAAGRSGKTKTVLQMVYIFTFLFLAIAGRFVLPLVPEHATLYSTVLQTSSAMAMVLVAMYTVYSGVEMAKENWGILQLGKTK